jgi:aryl-alcohol dehydrogenase-like predicted oxidoreductase
MDYTTLGRTGLRVSVMGLGCGGWSRLGQSYGNTDEQSVAVVQRALDLGVTFFDTAEAYGTEAVLGRGLKGTARDQVVISTKKSTWTEGGEPISADAVAPALEQSLRQLAMDYVDVYHLHGLRRAHYEHALSELVPELVRLRDQGKLRFIGVTEAFGSDTTHETLRRAVQDDCWDAVMVGLNLLNQSARERVLSAAREKNIGVLVMFAVRHALTSRELVREAVQRIQAQGFADPGAIAEGEDLSFLLRDGGAASLTDAAYRFARYEPGVHVVLSGTGSVDHLEENAASLARPPLPPEDIERLQRMFRGVDQLSGD